MSKSSASWVPQILVAVVVGVALSACGAGTAVKAAGTTSSTPASSSSSPVSNWPPPGGPTEEPAADEDAADEAIKTFTVGDVATVTQGDEDAATIVVTKAVKTKTGESEYADKPENGRFLVVTMTVKNIGPESFDINPFDFYAVDSEGNHYEYGDGNAFMAIDGKELNATTLNKGEKVTGRIVFDVPNKAVNVVYAPGSQALGQWTVAK